MRGSVIVAILLTALPSFSASAQRLEPSRFALEPTTPATSGAVAIQPAPQCHKSALTFAGQLLASVGGGVLGAVTFSAVKPPTSFDDYGFHRDSYGSADYLKGVLVASTLGASGGAWIAALRPCRAFVPALIGASLPAIFLGSQIKEEDADAIATAVTFLFALPAQAIAATVFQTIAR